jgi:predicted site-specific integrase-resolvase
MFEKLYTTGELAEIFGVSYVAVKKWAYSGKITLKRPAVNTGTLRVRAPKGRVAIYARVSSADQREDLERQKQRLVEYAKSKGLQTASF